MYCGTCGGVIIEQNQAYGINPQAVCHCCAHDKKPLDETKLARLGLAYHRFNNAVDKLHKLYERLENQ